MPVKRIPVRADDRVMVRNSERRLFLECRQAWQWAYVDRYKRQSGGMNALVFGDLIHRALAEFYIPETIKKRRRGPNPVANFLAVYDAMAAKTRSGKFEIRDEDSSEEKWIDARELGEEMMTNYWDTYGRDMRYVVICPEMPFQYDLYDGAGKYVCTFVGTTDALIYDLERAKYGLFEHKTAASINTSHLFIDDQAGTYWAIIPLWLAEKGFLKPGEDLNFMLYNFMRKGKLDTERPRNAAGHALNKPKMPALVAKAQELGLATKGLKVDDLVEAITAVGFDALQLGEVSKKQPAPLFKREVVLRGGHDRAMAYDRILAQVHEMNLVRAGELEVHKAPGKNCGFCEFRDVCELHEIGSDWEDVLRMSYRKWDPYEAHREVWDLELTRA